MQEIFDDLYARSKRNDKFCNLYDIIINEQNILLAYREIKRNKGSETAGTNKKTILNWENAENKDYVNYVRKRLQNFFPHKVKRVEIPKANGGIRPLGIPTIEDRLIQQCIKQVLEPILEAKFHPQSFGFRPNRSTAHAVNEFIRLVNINHLHFVIDIDIKSFFDNVDHAKLLKQLWTLGIRDKKLLSIISKMLKAEIEGIGKPTKGTPQGGILSPLLANVVLNEFDWWIDSQWKSFKVKDAKVNLDKKGKPNRGNVYIKLRDTTNLKEMFIVRYADDFKILCRYKDDSIKTYEAVKKWLRDRLNLEVSEDKSRIVDIRKKSSEFLGFRFKAKNKHSKWVMISHMSDKSKQRAINKLKDCIVEVKKNPNAKNVMLYNSKVMGIQNYNIIATHVNRDLSDVDYKISKFRHNQLKGIMSLSGEPGETYKKRYKGYNYKKQFVAGLCLFPLPAIRHKYPIGFSQEICNYTIEGRKLIHDKLKINIETLHYLMENPPQNYSVELADNRLSLYSAQWGKCFVTGEELTPSKMELHHKVPKNLGGSDKYQNLIWVTSDVHELIHATRSETISKYLEAVNLDQSQFIKLNNLREQAGNCVIEQQDKE